MCFKPMRSCLFARQPQLPSHQAPSPTSNTGPKARRNPAVVSIHNDTDSTIVLMEMRRHVCTPRVQLQPGEQKPLPAIPNGTFLRMAMFQHNTDLGLYVDSDDVSDMGDVKIRHDKTKLVYYLEPHPPSPRPPPAPVFWKWLCSRCILKPSPGPNP